MCALDLTQALTDSTLWTGVLDPPSGQDPAGIRDLVQALNGVGLVDVDDNQGLYFTPGVTAGTVDDEAAPPNLGLGRIPASGAYGQDLLVSAALTSAGQLRRGCGLAQSASAPLTFTVGEQRTQLTLVRDAGGAMLTATLLGESGLPLRERLCCRGCQMAQAKSSARPRDHRPGRNRAAGRRTAADDSCRGDRLLLVEHATPDGSIADLSDPTYAASASASLGLPPTAVNDGYSVASGSVLRVPAPGSLANDGMPASSTWWPWAPKWARARSCCLTMRRPD